MSALYRRARNHLQHDAISWLYLPTCSIALRENNRRPSASAHGPARAHAPAAFVDVTGRVLAAAFTTAR